MTRADTTLGRLRRLLTAAVDPPGALRALHAFLYAELPETSLALLLADTPNGCRLAGLIGPDGYEHVPAVDPFGTNLRLPAFDDALAARLVAGDGGHRLEVATGERGLPLASALLEPASVLALPIQAATGAPHWLAIGSAAAGRFDRVDPEHVLREALLAAAVVTRPLAVRVLEATAQRQQRAIEGLADVQRLLQPGEVAIRGLDYAAHWQPADTAAGDYYDLMPLTALEPPEYPREAGDVWGAMLADVSGHGAAAAMEAVQFDAILRTYRGDEPPLGAAGALTYANRHFFSRRQRRHFLTAFALRHDPSTNELQYVCAGHPPAALRTAAGTRWIGRDHDAGIPLGILREHRWDNAATTFHPGDLLVIYTDGVIDARDRRGRPFGGERLLALVGDGDADAAAVLARLRDALIEHQCGEIGADDQTVIVLRRVAPA